MSIEQESASDQPTNQFHTSNQPSPQLSDEERLRQMFPPGIYEIWSPYECYGAAEILMQLLEEHNSKKLNPS
jgi:hypothetical protein